MADTTLIVDFVALRHILSLARDAAVVKVKRTALPRKKERRIFSWLNVREAYAFFSSK